MALVTGATGALGPVLIRHLLAQGYDVRALIRRSVPPGTLPEVVELFHGDILDLSCLRLAITGVELVFHLAAKLHIACPAPELKAEYEQVNVEGTRRLAEVAQAAGIRRLVFFSTIAVYGASQPGQILNEESLLKPDTFYASTKVQAEKIVQNEVPAVVLRLAAIYGPKMKGNYSRLVNALRRGRFVPVGPGTNRRTLIYEQDAVAAAVLAAKHPAAVGEIYNITDGSIHTFDNIVATICQALGRRPPYYRLPTLPVRLLASLIENGFRPVGTTAPVTRATIDKLVEDVAINGDKIQRDLGFSPQFTLLNGWRETVRHIETVAT